VAASLVYARAANELVTTPGSTVLTGTAAAFERGRELVLSAGGVTINGVAVEFGPPTLVTSPGTVTLAGVAALLTYTPIPPPPEPVGHSWGTPNRGRLIAAFPHRAYALDLASGVATMRGSAAEMVVTKNSILSQNDQDEEALEAMLLLL